MDQSITLSNSPSPVKKTGNSQRACELAGELYSLVQQWHLLIPTGRSIINTILKSKIATWENPEHVGTRVELEKQCDQLASVINELEVLPKQMEKIRDQYVAIGKLEDFQQQKMSSNPTDCTSTLFLTWPTSKFVTVVTSIKDAYAEEFKLKKCIAENVAHCDTREVLDFHKISWVHQVFLTTNIKLELESLLVETGQR